MWVDSIFSKIVFYGLTGLLFVPPAGRINAGVHVWVPDTSVSQNSEIRIPVCVSSVERADSVIAYECNFSYDPEILHINGVDHEHSMTAQWGIPFVNINSGQGRVAAFTSNITSQQLTDTTNVWLYLNFLAETDTSCSTQVNLTYFRLFSLNGEMVTESIKAGVIHIVVNFPPMVFPFPGINILEDDSIHISFKEYIHDPNDSFPQLYIDFIPDQNVSPILDLSGDLLIKPQANWYGQTILRFQVIDPLGVSATGSIEINVTNVPDAPEPFSLISPNQGAIVESGSGFLVFEWEISEDADPDDQIRYRMFLGDDSLFQSPEAMQFSNLNTNTVSLNHQIFKSGMYFWKVIAEDGQSIRESNQIFHFKIIEPNSANHAKENHRFEICDNVPNPFNQETQIRFILPYSSEVRLDIFNTNGMNVRTLVQHRMNAGIHQVFWNGRDNLDQLTASGVYWIRLSAAGKTWTKRICLIK